MGQFPMWVCTPFLALWAITTMVIFQNAGSIGIKPKRYTIEWIQATKERERIENTNPVTRYLDRRRNERGGVWIAQYNLPWHPYWMWMADSHDPDFPEFSNSTTPRNFFGLAHPHLRYTEDISVSCLINDEE